MIPRHQASAPRRTRSAHPRSQVTDCGCGGPGLNLEPRPYATTGLQRLVDNTRAPLTSYDSEIVE